MTNARKITAITFIVIGNMLLIYNTIGEGWTSSVTTLLGYIVYFVGLVRLKRFIDDVGKRGAGKLIWAAILGIIAAVISFLFGIIPVIGDFIGAIPAGILNFIAFILQLIGLLQLKKSKTIGTTGAKGITYLIVAMILTIFANLTGILPFIGGFFKSIISFTAFILILLGWIKVQRGVIEQLVIVPTQQPEIETNIPTANNTAKVQSFDFAVWFKKNMVTILALLGFIIVVCAVYFIFIKHYPKRDAKQAAEAYCDCNVKYNEGIMKVYSEFVKSFGSNHFTKRIEARNKLQELQKPVSAEYNECINKFQMQHNTLRQHYISNTTELNNFQEAYNNYLSQCNPPPNQSKLTTLYSEVERKIVTIKDPEPDTNKIKSDLIGRKIPGWNFDNLTEFKRIEITNTNKGNNRIAYTVKLQLKGTSESNEHTCEVIIAYFQNNQGWVIDNITMQYITFDYLITPDSWTTIVPWKDCNNCTWSASNDKKIIWRCCWGVEQKSGPDVGSAHLQSSESYDLKSREGHPVTVRFTYKP